MASPASTASRSPEQGGDTPTRAHPAAKASGEVIAVTSHDDFLLELGEALGGQVSVRPVDAVAAALEHLSGSRRLQLLMIDSRGCAELRGEVDKVHARAPHVPVIVFAVAETEKSVAAALRSSRVFAVLPIPVDRRKTTAVFEGALAEAAEKRSGARGGAAPGGAAGAAGSATPGHARGADSRTQSRAPLVPEPAALPASSQAPMPEEIEAPASPGRSKLLLLGVALVAAALAGGALWFFAPRHHPSAAAAAAAAASATSSSVPATPLRSPSSAPSSTASSAALPSAASGSLPSSPGASSASSAGPASPAVAAAPVPAAQGTLDELLEKARLAMRERRYTEPATNSALLYYRSALGVDPSNGEARDGMARLAGLLGTRFDESLAGGHYDEATDALAGLKIAAPQDSRLAVRESQLLKAEWNAALGANDADRATVILHQAEQSGALSSAELARWRVELARHQTDARTKHFADLFNQRLREGQLLEPADDSAKYYLQQLGQIAPQSPIAQHGARDLVAACLRKAHDAALGGHPGDADKWVAEARSAGMTADDLAGYQRDLSAARQRAAAAESDRLAQLARTRMQDGHLIDPANDSALYYLDKLKSGDGASAAVDSIGRDFAARLLEQAARAARAGELSEMRSELTLAQHWGADPALVQAVQQIAGGRPAPAGNVAPGGAAAQLPSGFAPKRIHYEPPEFPDQALDQHISGSVELEFNVDLDGRTRDVRVVESRPAGVFDRAATNAVARWRYQPVVINGQPTEIPWRVVINFKAPRD